MMVERWAIKYRPKRFSEVAGQAHVIDFLKLVLQSHFESGGDLPVGFLFTGPSGVGKTTMARLLGAALNCKQRKGVEPCGECQMCRLVIEGEGGILELDASYFGNVENMRSLREELSYYGRNQVFIVVIDECHLMSREAFSVFLKLLEAPPRNVLFVLVTTEADRVIATVRSRLLEFRFTNLGWKDIKVFVTRILESEQVKVERLEWLLVRLVIKSKGNLREILNFLEQAAILGSKTVTDEVVRRLDASLFLFEDLMTALLEGNLMKFMDGYYTYKERGYGAEDFLMELGDFCGGLVYSRLLSGEVSKLNVYLGVLQSIYRILKNGIFNDSAVYMLFEDVAKGTGDTRVARQGKEVVSADEILKLLGGVDRE